MKKGLNFLIQLSPLGFQARQIQFLMRTTVMKAKVFT